MMTPVRGRLPGRLGRRKRDNPAAKERPNQQSSRQKRHLGFPCAMTRSFTMLVTVHQLSSLAFGYRGQAGARPASMMMKLRASLLFGQFESHIDATLLEIPLHSPPVLSNIYALGDGLTIQLLTNLLKFFGALAVQILGHFGGRAFFNEVPTGHESFERSPLSRPRSGRRGIALTEASQSTSTVKRL
jgi:hypothetical protein